MLVGMVDGCGYDGQLKCTICDIYRPYHLILNILKSVFCQTLLYLQLAQVPRSPDLAIFLLTTTITTQPIILPLAHAHRAKMQLSSCWWVLCLVLCTFEMHTCDSGYSHQVCMYYSVHATVYVVVFNTIIINTSGYRALYICYLI